jgi:AraC family transcriptional regulator of adaptative response/methylated-DNA-[protein]-cysteine methyltransferase
MSQRTNAAFDTTIRRWNAVLSRDCNADGAFLYAVTTTGVYCRPSCPSRRPKRENVVFFSDWRAAERAGYRACRKCSPRSPSLQTAAPAAVTHACKLIDQVSEPPRLKDLAAAVGLSPFYLHRLFKQTLGITPKAYAAQRRTQRFKDALHPDATVTSALYAAGFNSTSRCYESIGDALGMIPTKYKNGAAGLRIRYAVEQCCLGQVLVAATHQGVCMIALGESPRFLKEQLAGRFPRAQLVGGDPQFAAWVARVLAFIKTPRKGLDLPLDIQGTAFQRRVWEALRAIPVGATASYAAVARRIGRPKAVRAVAGACAANPVALAIPCHRVVGSDAHLCGYHWGIERKRALLDRESKKVSG